MNKLPRGLRNKNPLNIRLSNNAWLGKTSSPNEREFEVFEHTLYGIRAAFVCIRTHMRRIARKGIVPTTERVLKIWAPPSENDTWAYIGIVYHHSGGRIHGNTCLNFSDKEQMVLLLWAMSFAENGIDLPIEDFEKAYDMV